MESLGSITLFALAGIGLVGIGMGVGRLIRPKPYSSPIKFDPYECGEASIGSAQVQFDLRFYIVALIYLIFAVEIVLFYPWAVAYGSAEQLTDSAREAFILRSVALVDLLIFFGLLVVGFAYLWRFGYLEWVRTLRSSPSRSF